MDIEFQSGMMEKLERWMVNRPEGMGRNGNGPLDSGMLRGHSVLIIFLDELWAGQTHVHQVSDAIQPSHPLSSPSPLAPNPSQHQSLFQ